LSVVERYYTTAYKTANIPRAGRIHFSTLDAAQLCIPEKADLIVTSPPYCNRLDTITQYGPENYFLSALGYKIYSDAVIGTTAVKNYATFAEDFEFLSCKSTYANALLGKFRASSKPGEANYYLRYYTRYFAMLFQNIHCLLDNLSPKGTMCLVLQDNSHRGELIEIDMLLRQLLKPYGWKCRIVEKWPRSHLGLRNLSRDHLVTRRKQFEKVLVIHPCS
jgi:DNA modification methylase